MSLDVAQRMRFLSQSEIRVMTIECAKVGGVNLSQGVCDTPVPDAVKRAAQVAIDDGYNIYTRYDGVQELRRAIAYKLERENDLEYDPDSEIVATNGATGAFYCACLALLDPGDEVILFAPYYGYHVDTVKAVGGVPCFVSVVPPDWAFDRSQLEQLVSERTRAIVVNTPANPSGKVFSLADLETIAQFAEAHDLYVITDEIYEHFLYDGNVHISPATLPGMRERTITINGLSKTFAVTGWRIGFVACPARYAHLLGMVSDLVYICPPAPLQVGVAHGLRALGPDFYFDLAHDYTRKRDQLCTALARAGIPPHIPAGAYYVLADMSRVAGTTSKERVMRLLHDTGVASVPGDAFYPGTEGATLARFCFAKTDAALDDACRRLERLV